MLEELPTVGAACSNSTNPDGAKIFTFVFQPEMSTGALGDWKIMEDHGIYIYVYIYNYLIFHDLP
jgi:hypothetical protein